MLSRVRTPVAAVVLALLTVVAWVAVLGRDREYDVDPVTGAVSGPYGTGQVVLFGVLLLVLGVLAAWRGPRRLVFVVPAACTVAWSVSAATAPDGDGLWPVGAVLVAVGTTAGAAVVLAVVGAVRGRR